MNINAIAATKLSDVLKQQVVGDTVNVHVVPAAAEPQPNFEVMRRLVSGQPPVDDKRERPSDHKV